MSTRLKWIVGLAVAAFVVLTGGGTLAGLYGEFHWFRSLGYGARFWKLTGVEAAAWVSVFLLTAGAVWWVLKAALRRGGPVQIRRKLGDLEISEALPSRWVELVLAAAAALAGFLVASPFAGSLGPQALFALEAEPWGGADAILGHDPRFYVFHLPLLRTLWSVLVAAVTWIGLGLGTLLLLSGRVRATEQGVTLDPFARRALTWLAAGVMVLTAAHFGLSIYETVAGGPVGYADVRGEIPARRLLAVLALLAAGALVWAERTGSWRPALTALAVLVVAWPTGLVFYPEAIQRFRVDPNELELETPYIDAQVDATRRAFGLDEIRRVDYDVTSRQPPLERVREHASSVPLWDDRPLKATYDQLQGLLAYHEFPDVDVDRYGPRGSPQQVAIGVREFAPGRLDPSARTWQNLHLRYTHGTGWVTTAVDRATEGGEPRYFVQDLPPRVSDDAPGDMGAAEPKVYFGERTTEYVLVPPDSFPEAGPPAGLELGGAVRRGLMAWALESKNILLRDPGTGTPRLMWRRHVTRRVQHLAPFLLVDPDVYPVIDEGRVKWIVEVYSASARYPLSESHQVGGRGVNYVRSAAKAVVDGVTGETTFYAVDTDDPLLSTYRSAFPGLFEDLSAMPEGLRRHLRYPRSLFRTQAEALQAYHMTRTEEFYQRQDLWSVGREVYESQPRDVTPYYLVMPFPTQGRAVAGDGAPAEAASEAGGDEDGRAGGGADAVGDLDQEFVLTLPYTPRNRDNLASFLMARSDGEQFGELWLFDLSGKEQVFGPRQVEVQIDQDPVISQQLSLWQQQGSRAIRGHLLMVPVDGYLVYVEPLFLVAEDREGAAPGLKRVIAAAGDRVAMGEDLDDALQRLMGERARTAPLEGIDEAEGAAADAGPADRPPETAEAAPGTEPAAGPTGSTLERVRRLLDRADRALREGDLARFGELWSRIRETAGAGAAAPDTTVPAGADTAADAGADGADGR
jgi:uncharacterized membrane protein (UPF0182 family)